MCVCVCVCVCGGWLKRTHVATQAASPGSTQSPPELPPLSLSSGPGLSPVHLGSEDLGSGLSRPQKGIWEPGRPAFLEYGDAEVPGGHVPSGPQMSGSVPRRLLEGFLRSSF